MKETIVFPSKVAVCCSGRNGLYLCICHSFSLNQKISRSTNSMHADLKSWGLNCRKCCVSTTATTFEFDDRCALKLFPETGCFKKFKLQPSKLPTMSQFPSCKNEKRRKSFQPQKWTKKPHHFFNTELILEFNMSTINSTENSLTKRQILSSEQCMVRRTWSHTCNIKKKRAAHQVLSPLQWR